MRENHPNRRQTQRQRAKLARKQAVRQTASTALIACEGACTEPNYLRGVLRHLGLNEARVRILEGQTKSHAAAVAHRAMQAWARDPRDRAFVVVDGEHADLAEAAKVIKAAKGAASLIVSTPCFEVWLLLHFGYCDRPLNSCATATQELRRRMPDYDKNLRDIFQRVRGAQRMSEAIAHARRLCHSAQDPQSHSPATNMDELIETLQQMARETLHTP